MGWRTSASGFWDVLEQLQCIAIKGTLLSSMLKIPRSMFRLFTCVLINKKKKKKKQRSNLAVEIRLARPGERRWHCIT